MMQLTKPQQQIANDTNRWRIVAAGRRFGKTFLAIREMCYFARNPKKTIYACFPTYRMAKTVVWEELKERLSALRWVKRINETELTVYLVNGSKIVLAGADNPDRLRGISCDFVVFDEFADIDPDVWTVMRPTLADRGGHALWISSPKGKNHFYELYQWAQAEEGWSTYKFTTLEGGNVPEYEVEAAKREMDERSWKQEFMADWVDYVGLVYYAFNETHIKQHTQVADNTDPTPNTIHVGLDFNIFPMSAVISKQYRWGMHIIDEIELHNSNTFEIAEEIKRRYPNHNIKVYPDPAGSARKTSSNTTDHKILYNNGFEVLTRRAHPPVKDRINSVNSAFASGKILVDPKCKSLRNCLNKLSYREGTNEQDKTSGYDHLLDALGYMIEFCYPIKKMTTTRTEPSRWAMNAPAVRRFG